MVLTYIDLPTVIALLQTPCLVPQSQLDISDPCMSVITFFIPNPCTNTSRSISEDLIVS